MITKKTPSVSNGPITNGPILPVPPSSQTLRLQQSTQSTQSKQVAERRKSFSYANSLKLSAAPIVNTSASTACAKKDAKSVISTANSRATNINAPKSACKPASSSANTVVTTSKNANATGGKQATANPKAALNLANHKNFSTAFK